MNNLKSQIALLRKAYNSYEEMFPIITLDNGSEIKVGANDLIHALSSIGTSKEHRIVRELKGKQIIGFTGSGNMPQLIMSLIKCSELHHKG